MTEKSDQYVGDLVTLTCDDGDSDFVYLTFYPHNVTLTIPREFLHQLCREFTEIAQVIPEEVAV